VNYDFMTLSSEDFEALVTDLLSREWREAKTEPFSGVQDTGSSGGDRGEKTVAEIAAHQPQNTMLLSMGRGLGQQELAPGMTEFKPKAASAIPRPKPAQTMARTHLINASSG
jgi:hypothetical protein